MFSRFFYTLSLSDMKLVLKNLKKNLRNHSVTLYL